MKLLIKILFSIAILSGLLWWVGLDNLLTSLSQTNMGFILPGVSLYLFGQWVSAYRWKFLAEVLGFELPTRDYVDGYYLGMVASLFLPGAIGGDAVRTLLIAKNANKKKRLAMLTLIAERGVGLVIMLWLTALALCHPTVTKLVPMPIAQGVWAASLGLFIGWLLMLSAGSWLLNHPALQKAPKIVSAMTELIKSSQPYWRNGRVMAISLGLSLIVQGIMVIIHIGMAMAMGLFPNPVNIPLATSAYGLATLAGVLPVAFAGFGLREGTYQWALGLAGVNGSAGLTYGLYWAAIMLITTAVAGGWLVWQRPDLASWLWHKPNETKPPANKLASE